MARYTPKFKKEAVNLYESVGVGIKRTTDGLGITPETLRHWVKHIPTMPGSSISQCASACVK